MRIWSLHPKYLDTKGLLAVWREGLLAKNVLEGKTKGYMNHPQLLRFKASKNPQQAISQYLSEIFFEAQRRGYRFDRSKIDWNFDPIKISVTSGQMAYEKRHLEQKLSERTPKLSEILKKEAHPDPHAMFTVVDGEIEAWEKWQ